MQLLAGSFGVQFYSRVRNRRNTVDGAITLALPPHRRRGEEGWWLILRTAAARDRFLRRGNHATVYHNYGFMGHDFPARFLLSVFRYFMAPSDILIVVAELITGPAAAARWC